MSVPSTAVDASTPRTSRPSSRYRRLLTALRISAWGAAVILAAVAIVALLFLHHGDPEGSARIANREIELLLEPGERVQWRVPVMQRQWWNYFRVTHGVFAATDRRLVFVGVPPEDLFPHEQEPPELEEEWWNYEMLEQMRRQRVYFETRAGVTVREQGRRAAFAVATRHVARLDSLLRYADRRIAAIRAGEEAERRAAEVAAVAARQPVYHLVQRGEALEQIADRYGAVLDSVRVWNGITRDRIRAGQRLLVKRGS